MFLANEISMVKRARWRITHAAMYVPLFVQPFLMLSC